MQPTPSGSTSSSPEPSVSYHVAELSEFEAFERMLRCFLIEQDEQGFQMLTRKNLDFYRDLGRSYMQGSQDGMVAFAMSGDQPIGYILTGEDIGQARLDHHFGKVAFVWGDWVSPLWRGQGIGVGMLVFGHPLMVAKGFETAMMGAYEENKKGQALCLSFGAILKERLYTFPLKEESRGQRKQLRSSTATGVA